MITFSHVINLTLGYGFFWPAITLSLSILVSYLCYPLIIKISKVKRLMAKPNHRSVHSIKTPNLGGIGIFLAINLIITFLGNYFDDSSLLSLLGAITILFFTGLIDDLIGIKPKYKVLFQVLASLSIILITDLRINSLYGLLGIYEIPYVISTMLTVFFFVLLINAYNLIDGIDGLAGSYAITVSIFFGVFYYVNANDSMFFLSLCIVGSLISFLVFNFSTKEKIFMGDTGSLVIGFLLAYQAVHFLNAGYNPNFLIRSTKSPIFVLALFSFPLIDTARVFLVRLIKKKSPFTADKNHMHHVFLDFGLKHWKISLLGSLFTMFIVLSVFIYNELEINKQALFLVGLWGVSLIVVHYIKLINKIQKKKNKSKQKARILSELKAKKVKVIPLKDMA